MSDKPDGGPTDLVVTKQPMQLIELAIGQGADPDKLGKLMDLQERWEAHEAKAAYSAAMLALQRELPPVVCDRTNIQTHSRYPSMAQVQETIKEKCLEHGFTVHVDEGGKPEDKLVCVRVTIRHEAGHEDVLTRWGQVDNLGPKGTPTKTMVQGAQSTVTYLSRRMICAGFNVIVVEDDRDGNSPVKKVTEDQAKALEAIAAPLGKETEKRALAWLGVSCWADVPAARFNEAKDKLQRKAAQVEG